MDEFNGNDLVKAFESGVDAIALECNKRITGKAYTENNQYRQGYDDALGELLEWIEFDMEGFIDE